MRNASAVAFLLLIGLALFGLRACEREADVGPVVDVDADVDESLVLVGPVERVVDGDTLDVLLESGKIRVRMHGIDSPENDQPLAAEAADLLHGFVEGLPVELQVISQRSSYERMVARVYSGRADLDGEMVRVGMAYAERRYLNEVDDGESYCVLEHAARSAKIGIWALPAEQRIAPWEWRDNDRTSFTDYSTATAESCIAAIGKSLREQPRFEPLPQFELPRDPRCGTKRTCPEMTSCAEAKFYFESCRVRSLDGGGNPDGVPCNDLCAGAP
jgi:endonuclease YncB( thermonuclease family)